MKYSVTLLAYSRLQFYFSCYFFFFSFFLYQLPGSIARFPALGTPRTYIYRCVCVCYICSSIPCPHPTSFPSPFSYILNPFLLFPYFLSYLLLHCTMLPLGSIFLFEMRKEFNSFHLFLFYSHSPLSSFLLTERKKEKKRRKRKGKRK